MPVYNVTACCMQLRICIACSLDLQAAPNMRMPLLGLLATIGHELWLLTILHIMAKTKQVIPQKGPKAKKAVKAEPKKKAPPPKQVRTGTAAPRQRDASGDGLTYCFPSRLRSPVRRRALTMSSRQ